MHHFLLQSYTLGHTAIRYSDTSLNGNLAMCSPLADEPVVILDCLIFAKQRSVHDTHALAT